MDDMFPCLQYQLSDKGREEFDRIFKHGEHADKEESLEVKGVEVSGKDDTVGKINFTEKK